MLAIDLAAATNVLKNAPDGYIVNILTEVTLKSTLERLFITNLGWRSQAPKNMDIFTERVLNSGIFANPPAMLLRQQMNDTVKEWSLTDKLNSHQTGEKPHPVAPLSLPDASSPENLEHRLDENLSVFHRTNTRLKQRRSRPTIMWTLSAPVLARRMYAPPPLARLLIATIGVGTNTKNWKNLQNLIFRYIEPSSSATPVTLTTARIDLAIVRLLWLRDLSLHPEHRQNASIANKDLSFWLNEPNLGFELSNHFRTDMQCEFYPRRCSSVGNGQPCHEFCHLISQRPHVSKWWHKKH